MGSAPSKPLSTPAVDEKCSSQSGVEQATARLQSLNLGALGQVVSKDGRLSQANVQQWEEKAGKVSIPATWNTLTCVHRMTPQDPVLALSRTILSHTDMSATLLRREAGIADQHVFNLILPYTPTPITDQRASGRCWLFASTNVVRYTAAQKLGVADFQLSQV
jgi:bleomycin hydrolase